ncbi:histone deacetylase 5-like protein [Trifolium pratense]|uniref:Histone deacetylase 5-like protein n=1 Tax=Trifolium pratense TaxID=57577 RepID=A0A2K3LHV3_TRIPR|nr:histone deacetylase 5-like protein [Trifolium pratense]
MRACLEVLLGDEPHLVGSSDARPLPLTWTVIRAVRRKLSPYWSAFKDKEDDVTIKGDVSQDSAILKLGQSLLNDVGMLIKEVKANNSDVSEMKFLLKEILELMKKHLVREM